jgi:diguanylate cyclase (GGDEF)-like protein
MLRQEGPAVRRRRHVPLLTITTTRTSRASVGGYILIAELNSKRAEFYREVAEGRGFDVLIVRDGDSGRRLLQTRGAPVLLITDISLPLADGFALVAELRRLSPPDKSAVVVFSAFSALRTAAEGLRTRLAIAEVADKTVSRGDLQETLIRTLRELERVATTAPTEPGVLEGVLRNALYRVASTFRVPVALLSLDAGADRCFATYERPGVPLAAPLSAAWLWSVFPRLDAYTEPLVVPDAATHPLFGVPPLAPPAPVKGFVVVPLLTSTGHQLGALGLLDFKALALRPEQADLLLGATRRVADEIERRFGLPAPVEQSGTWQARDRHWAALERLALTDPLTGLSNRRAGEAALAREVARARRHGSPLCLALLDLDRFKRVNDRHGHAVGDQVLSEVSRILRASFRASDLVVRWGGDEFLVLLPDAGVALATRFVDRARVRIEASTFSAVRQMTLSAGVVEVGLHDEDPKAALVRADTMLYEAKSSGRNRVKGATENDDPATA